MSFLLTAIRKARATVLTQRLRRRNIVELRVVGDVETIIIPDDSGVEVIVGQSIAGEGNAIVRVTS